jgi:acetolactate decarboxylase
VRELTCELPQEVDDALRARAARTGEDVSRIVARALADWLQVGHSTVFQASTAGALMEGVAGGAVTVADLLRHGDLGLGTFAAWDGELVVVDGTAYRVGGDGVAPAPDDAETPFALVTRFVADHQVQLEHVETVAELHAALDDLRGTENEFLAARIDGPLERLHTRAVCRSGVTTPLAVAAESQTEFEVSDTEATMVGFWTPPHLRSLGITGWHLHAVTRDRATGGHVFDCRGGPLSVRVQHLADFRLSIPETAAFLHADLTADRSRALDAIEHPRS